MTEICQKTLQFAPWMHQQSRRLPGVMPLDMANWLAVDDAYKAQLAHKSALIARHRNEVLKLSRDATAAAEELLELVIVQLSGLEGFSVLGEVMETPDGRKVDLDHQTPLETISQLVQEDMCLLEKRGDEHVLTGALLCFPASWSLAQKFERPLLEIHAPVDSYTQDIAKRVQRLFDAVKPDRPLWRANALRYADPELYQPRTIGEGRERPKEGGFIRSERQSILRLPKSDFVVFSIHTTVVPVTCLSPAQANALKDYPIQAVSELA